MDSCNIVCVIAVGLFASMLYVMLNYSDDSALAKFPSTLTSEQLSLYNNVIKERMTLFLQGLIAGLLLGLIYLNVGRSENGEVAKSQCIFTIIVLATTYFYYTLYPKSYSMLHTLSTEEQRAAWWDVYTEMKRRALLGFLIGVLAFLALGYVLSKRS